MITANSWFSSSIGYYEGDQIYLSDIAVPPRPDPTYLWDGTKWAVDPTAAAKLAAAQQLITEAVAVSNTPSVKTLVNSTPAQVSAFINSTVVDLASAKAVILTLALIVRQLAAKNL